MGGTGAPRCPIEAVYEHVDGLIAQFPELELTRSHVARLAGVSNGLFRCDRPTVRVETYERIAAVKPQHVRLMPPRHIIADPTRDRVRSLMTGAIGVQAVARAAGVSGQLIHNVLKGQRMVRYPTHVAITSLTEADVLSTTRWAERWPTKRRLQALMANGWSREALAAMLGVSFDDVCRIVGTHGPIRVETARAVQHLYDRLGDEVGPSRLAMVRARSLGYLPPIHYGDDMRLPERDVVADEQRKARTALCVLAQTLRCRSTQQIVDSLRVSERHINRVRKRVGIRVVQDGDQWVPVEAWPGQFDALRAVTDHMSVYDDLDTLDGPDLDYVAALSALAPAEAA